MSIQAPDPLTQLRRQVAAIELLIAHRQKTEAMRRAQLNLIQAARREGVTNREIGHALGVTEGAIRAILRRATATEQAAA